MAHWIELEDLPGFPPLLRRMQVEFIGWLVQRFGVYRPMVPLIAQALQQVRSDQLTDLGSGQGGPIRYLAVQPALAALHFTLTDRYPSPAADLPGNVVWHADPVDALAMELPGSGPVSLFNTFHHFTPEQQAALVRQQVHRGVLVHEVLQPNLVVFLKILITTTVGQLLLAPFVRPFRWERLFFTYVLPVNLITIPWDGVVSVLRSDQPIVLLDRVRAAAGPAADVRGGMAGPWWAPVTWVHCLPVRP
ncbi:MAG: class I SAM-dependent methyltransferase [Flavobacteriales bacterium]